jgi:hypothetical protein
VTAGTENIVALNSTDNEKTIAAISALASVLDRLEAVLSEENSALEARISTSHEPFIAKKNQLLRELMTLQRTLGDRRVFAELGGRLRMTRGLVEKNHALLKLQVDALTEVSKIMTTVALEEQADGTYLKSSA